MNGETFVTMRIDDRADSDAFGGSFALPGMTVIPRVGEEIRIAARDRILWDDAMRTQQSPQRLNDDARAMLEFVGSRCWRVMRVSYEWRPRAVGHVDLTFVTLWVEEVL